MSHSHPPRRPSASAPPRDPSPSAGPRTSPPPSRTPPLSDDGLEAAKKRDAEEATGAAGKSSREGPGVGGDPAVESGRPEHDPERPKQDLRTPPM